MSEKIKSFRVLYLDTEDEVLTFEFKLTTWYGSEVDISDMLKNGAVVRLEKGKWVGIPPHRILLVEAHDGQ